MSSNTNSKKSFRRQKLDHLIELIASDPIIARDEQLFHILKKTVQRKALSPRQDPPLKMAPSLYSRYRGTGFPLEQKNGSSFPRWRDISSWLKVQLGLLVLAEGQLMLFKIGLHDELLEELKLNKTDIKVYIRDRINRCARPVFGCVPYYFFVIEDRDKAGEYNVPEHVHGAIEVLRCSLPKTKKGETTVKYRRIELLNGLEAAEYERGRHLLKEILTAAAGLDGRPGVWKGTSQHRRVWAQAPDNKKFSNNWATYAFKNVRFGSGNLSDNRVVSTMRFKSEIRNFWKLITKGEEAIAYWLARGRTR